MHHFSIIIPVYNGSKTLSELFFRIKTVFETEIKQSYEVIFVDDASKDKSWEVLSEIKKENHNVSIYQMTRNFGQHAALLCGFNFATGRYIITMDDDLQHPPEEIPRLINAIQTSEMDVILGSYEQKQHSWFRNIGTILINKALTKILRKNKDLKLTSFRIIRKEIINELISIDLDKPKINPMLLYITNRIKNTPVLHNERQFGKSGYGIIALVRVFFSYIINDSTLPLKFLSFLGITNFLVSFLLIGVYLIKYILGDISIPGWITTVVLILFFNGLILLAFGLVGEYLLKILNQSKRMPSYIIRKNATIENE